MTKDEAIEILSDMRGKAQARDYAINLAISALKNENFIACGDCKHYIPHDKRCGYWNHGVQPLMWCSQAERRWRE